MNGSTLRHIGLARPLRVFLVSRGGGFLPVVALQPDPVPKLELVALSVLPSGSRLCRRMAVL